MRFGWKQHKDWGVWQNSTVGILAAVIFYNKHFLFLFGFLIFDVLLFVVGFVCCRCHYRGCVVSLCDCRFFFFSSFFFFVFFSFFFWCTLFVYFSWYIYCIQSFPYMKQLNRTLLCFDVESVNTTRMGMSTCKCVICILLTMYWSILFHVLFVSCLCLFELCIKCWWASCLNMFAVLYSTYDLYT